MGVASRTLVSVAGFGPVLDFVHRLDSVMVAIA
jgi:hypothetical protein